MKHKRGMSHDQAVSIAARRLRVTRFEMRGDKLVRIVYSLVHSNNENDRAKAGLLKVVSDE